MIMNFKAATLAGFAALIVSSSALILSYNNHTEICEMNAAQQRHATGGYAVDWDKALSDGQHAIPGIRTMAQLQAEYPTTCAPADTTNDLISCAIAGFITFLVLYLPLSIISRLIRATAHNLEH
jgi:hypothetical protein